MGISKVEHSQLNLDPAIVSPGDRNRGAKVCAITRVSVLRVNQIKQRGADHRHLTTGHLGFSHMDILV
jgi:hypothetical protein